jgi:phospholipid transport system substrate-binding protein
MEKKMRKLNAGLLAFLLSLTTVSFAQVEFDNDNDNDNEIATTEVFEPSNPVQIIQTAVIKLNQLTTVAAYSPQLVGSLVETEVAPLFDFDYIANEVLLSSNLNLAQEEKAYFSAKIKQNIVSSLLSKLTQARSASFQFISAGMMASGAIEVKLKVNDYYSYGMLLDLIFHQTDDKSWKISDVVLNNDSLINYYQKMVLIKLRRYGVYGMLSQL